MPCMNLRRRIACPPGLMTTLRSPNYIKDFRSAEWGSGLILRSSNSAPQSVALGQKPTFQSAHPMSLMPPKADIITAATRGAIMAAQRRESGASPILTFCTIRGDQT